MNRFTADKKGVVFIVVLGILVLLVLLGVTFSLVARIDKTSSASYADRVRAKMIAQSGIETAIAKIKATNAQFPPEAMYWGEDANKNGKLDADEDQNKNGILNVADCPLDYALRPSFATVDKDDKPKTFQFKNHKRGYSGELPAVTSGTSDTFAIKITDCNSMICINSESKGLEQILNNIGIILDLGDNLGSRIINVRYSLATKKFSTKEELKTTLGTDTYNKVSPYLTVYAYINEKVVKPKPLSERPCRTLDGNKRQLEVGSNVYTWASLNPGKLELEKRAPININVAAKPILMAVFGNIEGFYLKEEDVSTAGLEFPPTISTYKDDGINNAQRIGIIQSTSIDLKKIGQNSLAEQIADKIITKRAEKQFSSWDDFDNFLKDLIYDGTLGASSDIKTEALYDIIRANANPNTLLNDFNPNKTTWRFVDKADLNIYTTEFCFQPMGYFEIESQGLLSTPTPSTSGTPIAELPRRILSDYRIKCIVKLWENIYQTTQKDFSNGTISKIPSGEMYNTSTGDNQALQLYPEPAINDYPKNCEADGQIMLATLQNTASKQSVKMRLHFDKALKANDSWTQDVDIEEETEEADANLVPHGASFNRPNTKSLFNDSKEGPGSLYPDGAYSEWGATPTYHKSNFVAYEKQKDPKTGQDKPTQRLYGSLSFWLKSNYINTERYSSTKPRILFSATRCSIAEIRAGVNQTLNTTVFELFAFPYKYLEYPKHEFVKNDSSGVWRNYLLFQPKGRYLWFWEIDQRPSVTTADEYMVTNDYVSSDSSMNSGLGRHNRNEWTHIAIVWDSDPKTGVSSFPSPCSTCGADGQVPIPCSNCDSNGKEKVATGSEECKICNGTKTVPKYCPTCGGNGRVNEKYEDIGNCPKCNGTKKEETTTKETCTQCNGTMKITENCKKCGGQGFTPGLPPYGQDPCKACNETGKKEVKCPGCKDGSIDVPTGQFKNCTRCGGSGKEKVLKNRGIPCTAPGCDKGVLTGQTSPCPSCKGSGMTDVKLDCPVCGGKDRVRKDSQGNPVTTGCSKCAGTGAIITEFTERSVQSCFALIVNDSIYINDVCWKQAKTPPEAPNEYPDFSAGYNLLRLGERYGSQIWNFGADSTIDEFSINQYDLSKEAQELAIQEFHNGRYYKGEATFTSDLVQIFTPTGDTNSMNASVSWTAYYPKDWDTSKRGVEIQFFDESNTSISEALSDPEGSDFTIPLNKTKGYATKIKYKLLFHGDTDDLNTPLLESPIFDDITIKIIYPEPMVLKWSSE
ncbi:MAG: hypothetical protein WC980_02695 [Candidatus Brocadiia bacterium]